MKSKTDYERRCLMEQAIEKANIYHKMMRSIIDPKSECDNYEYLERLDAITITGVLGRKDKIMKINKKPKELAE